MGLGYWEIPPDGPVNYRIAVEATERWPTPEELAQARMMARFNAANSNAMVWGNFANAALNHYPIGSNDLVPFGLLGNMRSPLSDGIRVDFHRAMFGY